MFNSKLSIQVHSGGGFLKLLSRHDIQISSDLQLSQGAIHGFGAQSGSLLS